MILALPHQARLLKCWGNEAVVYDIPSGDTHYLKPLTLALYQTCLENAGCSHPELAAALAVRLGATDNEEFRGMVDDVVDSLLKIGLLETA